MSTGSVLAQFTITLSQAVSELVSVDWFTSDGTAQAGVDYASNKGTVIFAPSETAKTVDILVYGRAVGSEDRSFFVEMLPPVNAILGASIGECIIHVDTTGSTPVTQIIVPTGPQGPEGKSAYQTWLDLGNTGSEQDFIDSLSPSPEEIAEDVAPLIDVGDTVLTAEGTEGLSNPDATTVKAVARRVAYVGAVKIATVVLADGDNLIGQSDLTGDVVDVSSVGLYPRIMRGTSVLSPQWSVEADGRLLIKDAVAGDVLYVCQYDALSGHAVKRQSREALRHAYAEAGYNLRHWPESFEVGGTLATANDVLIYEANGKAYSRVGSLPHTVSEGSTPGAEPSEWVDRSEESLRGKLDEDSGSSLVNTIQPVPGALKRAVRDALRERISLLDFMTPAQRDAVYSGADVDHQSAFTAARAWLASGSRTLLITSGTYNFTDTFDTPVGSCLIIDPKATLKFTSTITTAIRIRRGVMFYGNMAKLRMTNPAWDGIAVLFNGEDQFSLEEPCGGSGLDIDSATYKHGTGIHIEAVGPRHYVMFVNFTGWTFGYNMHYSFTFNCGSAGTSDPATWHWITSNTFSDIRSFSFHLSSMSGTPGTPAEVAGNNLLNVHHQSYNDAGLPVYFNGASGNTITGYIWDWNNANGSPVIFEGGARHNQILTNVDASVVEATGGVDADQNKVFDCTGGETGLKQFFGEVVHNKPVYHGLIGVAGRYTDVYRPDSIGGLVFWRKNTGAKHVYGRGPDPYTGTEDYSVDDVGNHVFGGGNNPTQSKARINAKPGFGALAIRMGSNGLNGIDFENSSGGVAGAITVNASTVVYGTSSDYRLKEEVLDLTGSGDFIDAMRPRIWTWRATGELGAGFIAHELQEISPSSVSGQKDAMLEEVGEDGEKTGNLVPQFQSADPGSAEVIANIVAEVQSLRARVAQLEQSEKM